MFEGVVVCLVLALACAFCFFAIDGSLGGKPAALTAENPWLLRLACDFCGGDRFAFPGDAEEDALVICEDCGGIVGTVRSLKEQIEQASFQTERRGPSWKAAAIVAALRYNLLTNFSADDIDGPPQAVSIV